ncbi:hypothetical protein SNEBB_006162 [Seison nebaliae]|nr:hypothetical protein SNEBB_006162 [Seison nebaliae]
MEKKEKKEKIDKKLTVTEEVWFKIGKKSVTDDQFRTIGTITIGVFGDVVPMTALNFVQLAKGFNRPAKNIQMSYNGTHIDRVVRDFMITIGTNVVRHNQYIDPNRRSIYGDYFADENFELSHASGGWASMANNGRNQNGVPFFITLNPSRWLDGKHVVFGRVLKGMNVVRDIGEEDLFSDGQTPVADLLVMDCGVTGIKEKYELALSQMKKDGDIF